MCVCDSLRDSICGEAEGFIHHQFITREAIMNFYDVDIIWTKSRVSVTLLGGLLCHAVNSM